MDSRCRKTEEDIRNAFYALRAMKDTRHIHVHEICERARINKSTFYRHYADVYALEEAIRDELVAEITADICRGPSIREDAKGFLRILDEAFNGPKNAPKKMVLFGNDPISLLTSVQDELRTYYDEKQQLSFEDYIQMSYVLGGMFAVFRVGVLFLEHPDTEAIYRQLIGHIQANLHR